MNKVISVSFSLVFSLLSTATMAQDMRKMQHCGSKMQGHANGTQANARMRAK